MSRPALRGKRIFITGGGSGLGRALALRYAQAGWKVAIGDLNEQGGEAVLAELKALGGEAFFLRCDVTKEADVIAARDAVQQRFGGVDIVVNNAGVAVSGSIEDTSEEDWQWIVDINLLGVARGCRVFTPLLKQQGGGWFINVASMAGLIHPPQMSAYNATKAAVVALSETLYAELQPHGIGTSVVCPAFFRTNLANTSRASSAEMASVTRHLVNKAKIGAEEIAEQVFSAVEKGGFRIMTHPRERRFYYIKRVLPFEWFGKGVILEAERLLSSGKTQ